ncbi:class I mannose-6-phosphate isomerase [Weissella viridescens]|uniref:Mannose-6-phosphate isomerase n=1 Tax=Weissella viridescens TaxID=1629 RepID=A0A3P2RCS1_WEIVI|nr:type I phosphomannose isomerase catalytic subunit [Weissella viridescens]RRG18539.1 class I mannose-6-phosphate isomerase [Weissella viridescens]
MTEVLVLKADLHEKMWGGTALRDLYGFDIPSDHTGEAWVVSGHPNGPTRIQNGRFQGMTLVEVWRQHPELFQNRHGVRPFPLLVKILDAHENLSVQVHPGNAYAAAHAHELGKTESWYILAAEPDAQIYFGHNAQTRAEFSRLVDQRDWADLLRTVPVHAGDFFYVPAGTLHALGAGVVALEIQQSSDTTYRVYDFDRIDQTTGFRRQLDLLDAKAVTQVPFTPVTPTPETVQIGDATRTTLVQAEYFEVQDYHLDGMCTLASIDSYQLGVVVAGKVTIQSSTASYSFTPGMSFVLLDDGRDCTVTGTGEFVLAAPGPAAK